MAEKSGRTQSPWITALSVAESLIALTLALYGIRLFGLWHIFLATCVGLLLLSRTRRSSSYALALARARGGNLPEWERELRRINPMRILEALYWKARALVSTLRTRQGRLRTLLALSRNRDRFLLSTTLLDSPELLPGAKAARLERFHLPCRKIFDAPDAVPHTGVISVASLAAFLVLTWWGSVEEGGLWVAVPCLIVFLVWILVMTRVATIALTCIVAYFYRWTAKTVCLLYWPLLSGTGLRAIGPATAPRVIERIAGNPLDTLIALFAILLVVVKTAFFTAWTRCTEYLQHEGDAGKLVVTLLVPASIPAWQYASCVRGCLYILLAYAGKQLAPRIQSACLAIMLVVGTYAFACNLVWMAIHLDVSWIRPLPVSVWLPTYE